MTVSRVINNHPNVSDETRKKVEEAIKKLNYHPSELAQSLARKKTNIIGLVVYNESEAHPYFFHEIINGVINGASKLGYDVLIFAQNEKKEYSRRIIMSHLVDGVVYMGVNINNDDIIQTHKENFPYVVIGRRRINDINLKFVAPNYIEGVEKATQYLIDFGHKRIGFIGASINFEPNYDKLVGYQNALYKNQIFYDPNLVYEKCLSQREGYDAMKKLIKKRPTAVIVDNTYATIGAVLAIRDEGLSIPEDISVIGFDDNQELNKEFYDLFDLEMTVLRIPKLKLGEAAAQALISQIENNMIDGNKLIPLEFVIKKSCKKLE